jgi:hypothetical protein
MMKRVEQLRRDGQGEQADRLMERLANAKREMGVPNQQQGPGPQGPGPQGPGQQGPGPQGPGPQGPGPQGPGPQGPGQQGPGPQGEMEQRMQHLRIAADNLHQVGMHDMADKLNREADEIQHKLQGPPPGDDPHRAAMEAMQHEFRILHERLNEINRKLDEINGRLDRVR